MSDTGAALEEFHRVAAWGRLVVCEFSRPTNPVFAKIYLDIPHGSFAGDRPAHLVQPRVLCLSRRVDPGVAGPAGLAQTIADAGWGRRLLAQPQRRDRRPAPRHRHHPTATTATTASRPRGGPGPRAARRLTPVPDIPTRDERDERGRETVTSAAQRPGSDGTAAAEANESAETAETATADTSPSRAPMSSSSARAQGAGHRGLSRRSRRRRPPREGDLLGTRSAVTG